MLYSRNIRDCYYGFLCEITLCADIIMPLCQQKGGVKEGPTVRPKLTVFEFTYLTVLLL